MRHLDSLTRDQIASERKSGVARCELSKRHKVPTRTIDRVLHNYGLAKPQLSTLIRATVIANKLGGMKTKDIAARHNVTRQTVWRIVRTLSFVFLAVVSVGCQPIANVRPVKVPKLEEPCLQLPPKMRQVNWVVRGEGSCVYASLTTVARWHHKPELAAWLSDPSQNGGGEYGKRLRDRLDQVDVPYTYTETASVKFLDWCDENRHGCILWWKQSHCCTFAGWVRKNDGKTYAAIIDNNHPEYFELTERSQFIRGWTSFGGFGLTLLYDPASPRPWLSYTLE